jgi:hypothetical protein
VTWAELTGVNEPSEPMLKADNAALLVTRIQLVVPGLVPMLLVMVPAENCVLLGVVAPSGVRSPLAALY